MAIKELFSVVQTTYPIDRTTPVDIHAGQLVALDPNGNAVLAQRGAPAVTGGTYAAANVTAAMPAQFIGIAADDAARTGNTFIQADPVGSTKVSADGTTFTANNNAFFTASKRALGDYQDETVSNVTDLNSGSTGYQGPRRGLGVYTYTPGAQFIVDGWGVAGLYYTTSATADTTEAVTNWVPGMMLTVGAASALASLTITVGTAGKLVRVDLGQVTYGKPVARLDKVVGTAGSASALYYITLV